MKLLFLACTALTLAPLAPSVRAQFIIHWSAFPGGGGSSTGGPYTLGGSIGPLDGAPSSGAGYVVRGGFWSGLALADAGESPLLRILPAGTAVLLTWPANATDYRLQHSSNFSPTDWTDVPTTPNAVGTEWQVRQPVAPGTRFYRLRRP